jgi:SRSO17 transposase
MDEGQLLRLKPELDRFLESYLPLFGHDGNATHARRFVQGLLHRGERRNAENIAEAMRGGPVRSLQAFITTGAWSDADVLARLRQDALEVLADDDAVWNTDETGFPKKGSKSVGVKRQYSGTLGRTDNCPIGVFANYCSSKGHVFLDRRLFLPQEWADDLERRRQAGVPDEVIFRTKPELGLAMIANAVTEGVPFRWVGGDSVYGDGTASPRCSPERGARYNSAVRYVYGRTDAMAVVKSEDGMVNIFPDLRPQIRRSEIRDKLAELRTLAVRSALETKDLYPVVEWLQNHEFYLTPAECDEANRLHETAKTKLPENPWYLVRDQPITPDPDMNESYYLPEEDRADGGA